ncbi:methylated-DNA--[protein]-cysteine S-methyltransferase [Herminiimonas fonticola]|uniref:Methylated-DNA--protein-cysteine methyltransferase n=1 Tax=Herminiimonas fonticola TaxID=303380 RepID=A0A4R6GGZ8_9BURK|nr:methylated-DNA--[protein]-cysteine S-methyltransferase [Herminiimonas fonticola]RBA24463.1 ogt: methylated-DNA-[protein]-cysteine S-methyltransferase [Herminiimonas fonticola]TDN93580.1 methylated-DNA-[protein]-cysteine S-methyltransferase [Herminiimonas fonticola]
MISYIEHSSPVGVLLIAATDAGICGIYFEEHKHFKGTDGWLPTPTQFAAPHLKNAAIQLDEYFVGKRTEFNVALDLSGTEFQRGVWAALSEIPFGKSVSYTQHAQALGNPKALRAVGSAIGKNPVSIIVPCHRVIGSSGAVTGYAGGLGRKRFLLALEGITVN